MTDRLFADQTLMGSTELTSPNGGHRVVMQGDGNLVLYRANGTPKWATGTDGSDVGGASFQGDGNLVLYRSDGVPIWASGTDGNAGAVLVLQDDGNLVIYAADGRALWATGTNVAMVRVTGFAPATHGFHFANNFPQVPDYQINIAGANIAIGDASNGLCGGMAFAVRDLFEAGQLPPDWTDPPASGPLFNFLARRLMDSFELPVGPLRYYGLMSPALPDHETWASQAGLAPRGRAWVAIAEEWPKIRAGLDAGRLMPMALILVKSADPALMGHNHQVLAWGYDLDGTDLAIRVYDPNYPNDATGRVELSIANPLATTQMRHCTGAPAAAGSEVFCFFTQSYGFAAPPADVIAPPQPPRIFTIHNATASPKTVKVFNPGDMIMLAPLPAGQFDLPAGGSGTWIFHDMLTQVRVTANDRPQGLINPGDTITITQDDSVLIRNRTGVAVHLRVFKADDRLRWFNLPNGDQTIAAFSDCRYILPGDVSRIAAVINGRAFEAGMAEVILFQG